MITVAKVSDIIARANLDYTSKEFLRVIKIRILTLVFCVISVLMVVLSWLPIWFILVAIGLELNAWKLKPISARLALEINELSGILLNKELQ